MNDSDFEELKNKIALKNFSNFINGYTPIEVDGFLTELQNDIENLKLSKDLLQKQLDETRTQITVCKTKINNLTKENKRLKQAQETNKSQKDKTNEF